MTKEQAIKAMKAGKRVTHPTFLDHEWITMRGNITILTEEGYSIYSKEFWAYREGNAFDKDWSEWDKEVIEDPQEYLQQWEKEHNPFYPNEMRWDRLKVNTFLKDWNDQYNKKYHERTKK